MTADIEFQAWPKTPRLFRDVTITEKIDGTNAAVIIRPDLGQDPLGLQGAKVTTPDGQFIVGAQSRNRLITPLNDNYGFAQWVLDTAPHLAAKLGPGHHYGEWWGRGIQRGYGLGERRFSLFNPAKYELKTHKPIGLYVVPTLYEGPFDTEVVNFLLEGLRNEGSVAAPGFAGEPEGVIVYHSAARQVFKALIERDDVAKSVALAQPLRAAV